MQGQSLRAQSKKMMMMIWLLYLMTKASRGPHVQSCFYQVLLVQYLSNNIHEQQRNV